MGCSELDKNKKKTKVNLFVIHILHKQNKYILKIDK